MLTHCEQMCQHCEVCRTRDTPSSSGAVSTQVMKGPPFPFHTVSIDHKTVTAPKGTKYQYNLMIVDMLTRFVTAIPRVTTSAEETLSILMNHVITKYSCPMVIKSDHGSAFRNELTRAFAKYAGLRRAFVLPYNAPANGMAEQAVARIA
eukprot:852469-Pleurochrysis_carterae.AAC.1